MHKTKKDSRLPFENKVSRIFELIFESIGFLQILASPTIIGLFIGALVYLSDPTIIRLVIGIAIAAAGLVIGIIWATKQWKGKGTIWFMSRIMATPELDRPDEEKKQETTSKGK